jgi:hypothetical protein
MGGLEQVPLRDVAALRVTRAGEVRETTDPALPCCTAHCRVGTRQPSKHGANMGDGRSLRRQTQSVTSLLACSKLGAFPGAWDCAEDHDGSHEPDAW